MATKPSMPSRATTVSIESAMTSRETSEYRMPGVPMQMPSETVMVPKMIALPPAGVRPGLGLPRELVDVHVAGRDHAPGRGDADLRFLEILARESDRMKHRPAGRPLGSIGDQARMHAMKAGGAVNGRFF